MANDFFHQRDSFLAFRLPDFRKLLASKFLLTLGLQIQFVVLSWQVYEITKDPLSLGETETVAEDMGFSKAQTTALQKVAHDQLAASH